MRREITVAIILFALLAVALPGNRSLRAEGGHAPGITMEPDSVTSSVPCDTTLDFVWFTIYDPRINSAIDLLVSSSYESSGHPVPDRDLVDFLDEIYGIYDNTLGYPLTDMELIYEYFAGGESFPVFYLETGPDQPYPMNERNHVDIYMDCPGIDELPVWSMQPSAYSDSDEDPDTTVCTFHDNSLVTGGPDTASIGDGMWYRYSAPIFNHEFAHLCYKSQGIAGTLEENEMFAHFAGYLGGTPYKRPRFNPDYDACLMRANDEYAGDNDRRRNLWNLWGAYERQLHG